MNSFKKHKINLVDTGCLQDSRYKAYFKKFVKPLKTTISLLLPLLVVFTLAQAGSLSPLSSPAATSYTLSDIYARLSTNASATAGSHSFGATTTPQSTFPTLTQIYSAIPTIYATDLLATSTYLGVTGTIAVKSGDADASVSATSTNKLLLTPATGYYNGSTATVSTTTTAFTPSSIKLGTYLFGIVGTLFGDTDASKVLTTASAAGTTMPLIYQRRRLKKGLLSACLQLAFIPAIRVRHGLAPPSLKPPATPKTRLGTGLRTATAMATRPTPKTEFASERLPSLPALGMARNKSLLLPR